MKKTMRMMKIKKKLEIIKIRICLLKKKIMKIILAGLIIWKIIITKNKTKMINLIKNTIMHLMKTMLMEIIFPIIQIIHLKV